MTITARKTTAKAAQINRTIPDPILVLLFVVSDPGTSAGPSPLLSHGIVVRGAD
jgi:hypothetical protein